MAKVEVSQIEKLIGLLARLPGLGPRSARRAVVNLIAKDNGQLEELRDAISDVIEHVEQCHNCGSFDVVNPCNICKDDRRGNEILILVETMSDLWAMEKARGGFARYHVLGGVLSALDGVGPDHLNLRKLPERIEREGYQEIIIATSATVEGQSTAHYISGLLNNPALKLTRLAHGIPVGGELDYLDDGTINAALQSRQEM